jgi:hypothetical protein
MIHLQEDGCTYRNGMVCLHANGISSLVCGRVWPEDELLGSKHVEDIIKKKLKNIIVTKVHFVG